MSSTKYFSILGEVDNGELLNDAVAVLNGMGLTVGDVVISHRAIEGVYPVSKYERWL